MTTNQAEIFDQEWCKELIVRLKKYPNVCARLKALEEELDISTYPSGNLVATYGEVRTGKGLGAVSPMEIEFREKRREKQLIDAALSCLTNMRKDIIELRYMKKAYDHHIIEFYLPEHYKDRQGRPLYIGQRTLERWVAESLRQMAECLADIPYKVAVK